VIATASSPRHPPVPILAVALFPRIPTSTSSPASRLAQAQGESCLRGALCALALCSPPPGPADRVLPAWIPASSGRPSSLRSDPPGHLLHIRPATSCTSARIAPRSGPPAWYSIRPASSARIAPRSGQLEAAASAAWTSAVRPPTPFFDPQRRPLDPQRCLASIPSNARSSCSLP
jgi:hypothetical protein